MEALGRRGGQSASGQGLEVLPPRGSPVLVTSTLPPAGPHPAGSRGLLPNSLNPPLPLYLRPLPSLHSASRTTRLKQLFNTEVSTFPVKCQSNRVTLRAIQPFVQHSHGQCVS